MTHRQKHRPKVLDIPERLYSVDETAELLGVAPQTLAHWRVRGRGPRYIAISARCVRYRLSDIQGWLDRRVQESTAENVGDGQ